MAPISLIFLRINCYASILFSAKTKKHLIEGITSLGLISNSRFMARLSYWMGAGVLSIRQISIRRIPIIGLGLGIGLELASGLGFGELKYGELKRNRGAMAGLGGMAGLSLLDPPVVAYLCSICVVEDCVCITITCPRGTCY